LTQKQMTSVGRPCGTETIAATPPHQHQRSRTDDELADLWYKQSLDWMEFANAVIDAFCAKNSITKGGDMNWIREHIHTIAVLLAVALVVLAGIVLGGIFAFLSGFWLVASGSMDGMVITSWGY
jgi:hypothetical protein